MASVARTLTLPGVAAPAQMQVGARASPLRSARARSLAEAPHQPGEHPRNGTLLKRARKRTSFRNNPSGLIGLLRCMVWLWSASVSLVRSSEVGDLVPASPNALETVSTIAEEEPTPNRLVGSIKEDPKKKAATTPRTAPRLTAGELDKAVTISLVETETFWLLDFGECDTHLSEP